MTDFYDLHKRYELEFYGPIRSTASMTSALIISAASTERIVLDRLDYSVHSAGEFHVFTTNGTSLFRQSPPDAGIVRIDEGFMARGAAGQSIYLTTDMSNSTTHWFQFHREPS